MIDGTPGLHKHGGGNPLARGRRRCPRRGLPDPTARRVITELFAGHGWPDGGDELLGP